MSLVSVPWSVRSRGFPGEPRSWSLLRESTSFPACLSLLRSHFVPGPSVRGYPATGTRTTRYGASRGFPASQSLRSWRFWRGVPTAGRFASLIPCFAVTSFLVPTLSLARERRTKRHPRASLARWSGLPCFIIIY